MHLIEKRLIDFIKTEKLPLLLGKLSKRAGYPIRVDIDWNSFVAEESLGRLDVVFDDLDAFMKKICADEVMSKILQENLTTIRLINTHDENALKMELSGRTLSLTVQLAGSSFLSQTDVQIVNYVENLLKYSD
jgi:hypothetical protein